ncbi:hypothetical protein [Silvimonas sp.]|nr:hypothetical protein [Silvimonas sp.]MDR3429224.1 hypothetical protein [Silvimonas sp.]
MKQQSQPVLRRSYTKLARAVKTDAILACLMAVLIAAIVALSRTA